MKPSCSFTDARAQVSIMSSHSRTFMAMGFSHTVLARLRRGEDDLTVQRGGRDDDHGVHAGIGEYLGSPRTGLNFQFGLGVARVGA